MKQSELAIITVILTNGIKGKCYFTYDKDMLVPNKFSFIENVTYKENGIKKTTSGSILYIEKIVFKTIFKIK